MAGRRLVQFGTTQLRALHVSMMRGQSYQQEASHTLQGSQSTVTPEHSLYKEGEVRDLLKSFPGGSVHLDMNKNGIATITMKHEGKKNAMTGKMMLELCECVDQLDSWKDGWAVLLRGADGEFCTGGDFHFVKQIADPVSGAKMSIFMQALLSKFHGLPLISVAHIEGHAFGGGAELAVACDYRLMHPKAKIGFVQARLGILTGWGGGTHLTRIVGPRKAELLLTSAKVVNGEEAAKMNLVEGLVESSEDVWEWWQQFKHSHTTSMRGAKRIVQNATDCPYAEALNRERDIFTELWGGEAHLESLAKIKSKASESQKK